jgi:MerR family transcriptional regulator/heat shock protein HspR
MRRYALVVRSITSDEVTLEHLAERAEMHPELVARLVDFGLLQPVATQGTLVLFDSAKISRLHSIKRLRNDLGINLSGVAVVLDLIERLRDLERENASLRAKL